MARKSKIILIAFVLIALPVIGVLLRQRNERRQTASFRAFMEKPMFYLEQGNSHANNGDYSLAIKSYEEALALYPAWSSAQDNLKEAQKRLDPASWLLEHPDDDDARTSLIDGYLAEEKFVEARKHAALLSDPMLKRNYVKMLDEETDLKP